ncbi:hypothetical protein [Bacillus pakistanensis]|nr:hypothetical protein [Bacillus pakistanensis]
MELVGWSRRMLTFRGEGGEHPRRLAPVQVSPVPLLPQVSHLTLQPTFL